jgi:hypothetical protein
MKIETIIELEEFRNEQHEYFDEEGYAYRNAYHAGVMGRMLKLIDILESEIKELEMNIPIKIY